MMEHEWAQSKSRNLTSAAQRRSPPGSGFVLEDNREASQLKKRVGTAQGQPISYEDNRTVQRNNTGLPDNLKSGIENLSGHSMDDVKVHYNSPKPAQLQAHAYAQGTNIHLGAGQEKHLPHEAWHVVQQKQGRVKPTMQMKGNVNDNAGLEREADVMGAKSLQGEFYAKAAVSEKENRSGIKQLQSSTEQRGVVQRIVLHALDSNYAAKTETHAKRAREEVEGNGFGEGNLAEATVITPPNSKDTIVAGSWRGAAHSEEDLIVKINDKYKGILMNDPSDTSLTRIVSMYTERKPCEIEGRGHPQSTETTADRDRQNRRETFGNCMEYLQRMLHPKLPVYYSVPVSGHNNLMNQTKSIFYENLVRDGKCLSYAKASGKENRRLARVASHKLFGQYGRDYTENLQLIDRIKAKYFNEARQLNISIWPLLMNAFLSEPHYKDGEEDSRVQQRLKNIESEIIDMIEQAKTKQQTDSAEITVAGQNEDALAQIPSGVAVNAVVPPLPPPLDERAFIDVDASSDEELLPTNPGKRRRGE